MIKIINNNNNNKEFLNYFLSNTTLIQNAHLTKTLLLPTVPPFIHNYYNESLNKTTSDFKLTNETIILALILSSIVILTVFGNILVLLAIFFDFHLRSPTHYLMGSLALADLLLGSYF
jgi:hypothetical protein